jgi:hypothetical protein
MLSGHYRRVHGAISTCKNMRNFSQWPMPFRLFGINHNDDIADLEVWPVLQPFPSFNLAREIFPKPAMPKLFG